METNNTEQLKRDLQYNLSQFHGSEYFTKTIHPKIIASEGVMYLAEEAKAYWLIDAITSYFYDRSFLNKVKSDERLNQLQFWTLTVDLEKQSAELTCIPDKGETPVVRQAIPYTDFPLESSELWLANNGEFWTMFLPSEY